jgi:protein-L-isoaspartate(D-aspartate) O-methyltransferase
MQGLAIDGRQVSQIRFQASFACRDVVVGPHPNDLPCAALTFYDQNRKELSTFAIGPFDGTKTWKSRSREIRVPVGSREAIVRIGLFGATGSAWFDQILIEKVEK